MTLLETIAAIKKQTSAATEGPWKICKEEGHDIIGNKDHIVVELAGENLCCKMSMKDAVFIAASRTNVVNLCDALELAIKHIEDAPKVEGCTCESCNPPTLARISEILEKK